MTWNNKILIGIILLAAVLGGAFYYTQNRYKPTRQQQAIQQLQTTIEANAVTIRNFAFNPETITVKQGAKVTWINQDPSTHKLTSDTFNSGDLHQGDMFTFTFNNKESFDYSCSIHPSMTGKIVVE